MLQLYRTVNELKVWCCPTMYSVVEIFGFIYLSIWIYLDLYNKSSRYSVVEMFKEKYVVLCKIFKERYGWMSKPGVFIDRNMDLQIG